MTVPEHQPGPAAAPAAAQPAQAQQQQKKPPCWDPLRPQATRRVPVTQEQQLRTAKPEVVMRSVSVSSVSSTGSTPAFSAHSAPREGGGVVEACPCADPAQQTTLLLLPARLLAVIHRWCMPWQRRCPGWQQRGSGCRCAAPRSSCCG